VLRSARPASEQVLF